MQNHLYVTTIDEWFIYRASVPSTPIYHTPAATPGTRSPNYPSRTRANRNTFLGASSGSYLTPRTGVTSYSSSMATSPMYPRSRMDSESSSISREPLPKNIIINKDPFPVHLKYKGKSVPKNSFNLSFTFGNIILIIIYYYFQILKQLLKKIQMWKQGEGV